MSKRVVIIGAGMGGLTAAIRLARLGFHVRVIEARSEAGGLASGIEREGFSFDAGPYILLDRPGLEWAFQSLGLELSEHVSLRKITDVYEVNYPDGIAVRFLASLDETAAGFERIWPGSGKQYVKFVRSTEAIYKRLQPMLHTSRPGLLQLLNNGAWRNIPFLLQSLHSVLSGAGLPEQVQGAIAIWTHVAAQRVEDAPSPLAFVPSLIHTIGAFYPVGGIGTIPRALVKIAESAGVEFSYGSKARSIKCDNGSVSGVETDSGFLPADAVVCNTSGVGAYIELLEVTPEQERERLRRLPLQSPGACAYLAVKAEPRPPYLRFYLPGGGELCRLFVMPSVMVPEASRDGWHPARLIAPMEHRGAEQKGSEGQRAYLDRLLAEEWWQKHVSDYRVLETRIPVEWGAKYNLYRDSMNPVMTASFMRAGRLAHRSPYARGLYLSGSSTHPGQWVSFCAISGLLAADCLREDLG
jgi:phytoene dehydrogenase-like protein